MLSLFLWMERMLRRLDEGEGRLKMFISIRKYDGVGDVAEINRIAQAELFPLFSKQTGFVSYSIVDLGNGSAASISVFNTRATNASIPEIVQRLFKNLLPNPPTISVGEVLGHTGK